MPTQNIKVRSGNRCLVMMDNKAVGLIQSYRATDDYGPEAASGVGDIHAVEYVPTMARHTLSVSTMVLFTSNMRQAGVAVENGDGALKGMVFDVVTMDKDNGGELRTYVGCSYASGDLDVSKHAIVMSNAQFNALDARGTGL
jgi:hypothetical protein